MSKNEAILKEAVTAIANLSKDALHIVQSRNTQKVYMRNIRKKAVNALMEIEKANGERK